MDLTSLIIVAASVAATLTVLLVFAAGWFAASRAHGGIHRTGRVVAFEPDGSVAGRISVADLRERVRRLEAIAAGIDP